MARARGCLLAPAALLGLVLIAASTSARCFAALVQPKRPASGYMQWLSENRPAIAKKVGGTDVTAIAKAAGDQWKKVPEKQKAAYADRYAKLKKKYDDDMEKFLQAGGVVATKTKKKAKAKKDPNAPKRPGNAYMLWLKDNRKAIVSKLPAKDQKDVVLVTQAAGEAWKKVGKADKAKYEKAYVAAKAKYQKELAAYKAEA